MDIQEEAILIPDWLRLKMLRSEVMPATRRLAFAAVRDLEVNQIVLFVQSFGIPVESMNLLLEVSENDSILFGLIIFLIRVINSGDVVDVNVKCKAAVEL